MKIFILLLSVLVLSFLAVANKIDVCSLKPSVNGHSLFTCNTHLSMWSYDAAKNKCVKFIYRGCGGNQNRFGSRKKCENMCIKL